MWAFPVVYGAVTQSQKHVSILQVRMGKCLVATILVRLWEQQNAHEPKLAPVPTTLCEGPIDTVGGHVNGWQRPAFGSRPPELCACMEAAVCVQTVINFYLFQTALCHWTALCLCSDGAGWSTIPHDTWFYEHDGIWHRVHAAAVFRLRSQGFHLVPAGVVWTVIFLSAHNRVRIAMESTENCVAGR